MAKRFGLREYTEDEKRALLNEHFRYEVAMLVPSSGLMKVYTDNQSVADAINSISIESFLMHLRNLLEFLQYIRTKSPDTAVAQDFMVEGRDWERIKREKNLELGFDIRRIQKEISHLTYDRVKNPKTSWDRIGILRNIWYIASTFLDNCDERYVGAELKELKTTLDVQLAAD